MAALECEAAHRRAQGKLLETEAQLLEKTAALEATDRRCRDQAQMMTQLAETLAQEKARADAAVAGKSDFLSTMSHELRTPLNAIIGFSEIIMNEMVGPLGVPVYGDYARDIRHSGMHLLDVINKILDLARLESGKFPLQDDAVDLASIVDTVVRSQELPAKRNGVTLTVRVDANLPALRADARSITQMAQNLVTNAIKFTPRGGEVAISVDRAGGGLALTVHDSGIGIPEDMLATITEPFAHVDSAYSREHEGSGLGLALTKLLVELHDGALQIRSEQRPPRRSDPVLSRRTDRQPLRRPGRPSRQSQRLTAAW